MKNDRAEKTTASRSRVQTVFYIAAALVAIFFAVPQLRAQAPPEPLAVQVKNSIARGVGYLYSQQKKDGSFERDTA